MYWLGIACIVAAAPPANTAELPPAEYGVALAPEQALAGWISLFDGKTSFGWTNAALAENQLAAGKSTSEFGPFELRAEATQPGSLVLGNKKIPLAVGTFTHKHAGPRGKIALAEGLVLRSLVIRPAGLQPLLNGRDLSGWKRVDRANLPENKRPTWELQKGALRATGGPGAMEYEGLFGDFVLQMDVQTRAAFANGGLFFRSRPGDFMNGYEAQIYNRCENNDPGQPSTYSTGSLDDRQLARRLVSRDGETFRMTVIAVGPHIATWVNGYQLVDWTDTRARHDNPRQGLRLEPGTLQLQAHDPQTDLDFKALLIAKLE